MTAAATLEDVTMRFRSTTAVDGVTASIEAGTITGLLGRNGAGKTTLMQLLTGHRVPTSGRIRVFGEQPYENEDVLRRICFVKEGQRYPDAFRVKDAVEAASWLHPDWDDELAQSLLADFELPLRRPVKKLSRGMTSAVGIVIGLASRAPLTIFDEPYLGLDAVARQLFYDRLIADYAEHPRTVLLSTHLIEEIGDLLEHVLLIDSGRLLLAADADSLRDSAVTVTGPADRVAGFGRGRTVLRTESLGAFRRSVVSGAAEQDRLAAQALGLTAEPTSLQQLVVALSHRSAPSTQPPVDGPVRLEEVS
jgi:ABC-2 type transport system ATP-binding protein